MPTIQQARKSALLLAQLERLLDGGRNWLQGELQSGDGKFCIVGGMRHIRKTHGYGDKANAYLQRAIASSPGGRCRTTDFNDTRLNYGEVLAVITEARELAERSAEGAGESATR